MIQSHIEHAQIVWSPYEMKHMEVLEAIKSRATKTCVKKLSYSD
jgi:hypothetical protein